MSAHVRVCRECGEEYRPEITRCADCGGELVDRLLDDDSRWPPPHRPAEEPASEPPDLSHHRVVFVSARAPDLVPLAERLRDSSIAFLLDESPGGKEGRAARYSLLVHEDKVAAAMRSLGPLLAGEGESALLEGVETHYEDGQGYRRCPACETEVAPGAKECVGCGLVFGHPGERACPRCASPLEAEEAVCPTCGASGKE
jgi:hypothetical protein